jgi:ectoine hydroxylase-related dioxygenase (phytanoyl-CoA dioxygenase family)
MGGHASMCPLLICSIYLAPSRPETGELRMLPGSHEASMGFFEATDPHAPRGVGIAADPGDLTLHYGDIMHAAPPPTGQGPFRRCVLLSFGRADAFNHRGDASYNDVLLSREDGQVEHLSKVARERS